MSIAAMPPWLQPQCRTLQQAWAQGRFAHSLLIEGGRGRGGNWLASWTAALAHCREPARPCLRCADCERVFADQQPDVYRLMPEEDSREIRIDQVRTLAGELALTRHGAGRKVAILTPADRLNRNAANALLKTLEEPSGESLLILVAALPSRLPATIRSRCMRLRIPRPAAAVALAWLEAERPGVDWPAVLRLHGGEPIAALEADVEASAAVLRTTEAALGGQDARLDPIALADGWSRQHYELRLAAIENCITDALRDATLAHLPAAESRPNIRALFAALDATREAVALADTPVNKTLVLERLLWMLSNARSVRRSAS